MRLQELPKDPRDAQKSSMARMALNMTPKRAKMTPKGPKVDPRWPQDGTKNPQKDANWVAKWNIVRIQNDGFHFFQ